ncbi:hypothetical protein PR048_000550 [Dryococelus australis]|uniref:SPIN-DOC-like zinc-finger domain-containing protein n=1 Tax=Dryococelus australis TaxID=614101 RepID=A0ABQ9IGD2_9NEOP|nr:hypothetical protein PR048_000550 [Dryococelus australis]
MSLSTLNKKRKVEFENRQFNERWENKFLFMDFGGKPQCNVCTQVMSVMKEYNILHHYEITHRVKYGSVIGEVHKHLISELKSKMHRRRTTFFKATHVQKSCVQASTKHQDPELQMELCKLQSDILLSSKQNLTYGQLWNFVMPDKYPKLHNIALKVTSMFRIKSEDRLSQEALKSNLRIVTTEMETDIVALVNEHPAQCSH